MDLKLKIVYERLRIECCFMAVRIGATVLEIKNAVVVVVCLFLKIILCVGRQ